jgi:hypothetical protein
LKGKVRGRYAKHPNPSVEKQKTLSSSQKPRKRNVTFGSDSEASDDDDNSPTFNDSDDDQGASNVLGQDETNSEEKPTVATYLDGDFLELTGGRPLPMTDKAKSSFHFSVLNVSTR